MSALMIDGRALAEKVQNQLTVDAGKIKENLGRYPHLAVVLVGDNPASKVYVNAKTKRAKECGIEVTDCYLSASCSQSQLEKQLSELSARKDLDGILLQLPLPQGLDESRALACISPEMDVDGLHPLNQGLLLQGLPAPLPCTPKGCLMLIEEARQQLGASSNLRGLKAVVVGRSLLVGKPMGILLLSKHCTVTMCHSQTIDLAAECRQADVLVCAVGREKLIKADFIKPGAIVIDVGTNRNQEGKLVGDVDFAEVSTIAGAVTPVPGGVGPMTIAMLLANTIDSAKRKISQ